MIITKFKRGTKEMMSIGKPLGIGIWMFVMLEMKVGIQAIWIGGCETMGVDARPICILEIATGVGIAKVCKATRASRHLKFSSHEIFCEKRKESPRSFNDFGPKCRISNRNTVSQKRKRFQRRNEKECRISNKRKPAWQKWKG